VGNVIDNEQRAVSPATAHVPVEILLTVDGLAKRFGATRAVRNVSFDVRAGEVHAIVGENGSGKSTLVKMLSGVHYPDQGSIVVAGEAHTSFREPRAAQSLGISTVFQEVLSVESRSVLDNLWLGADGFFRRRVGRKERVARARAVLADLLDSPPPLDRTLEDLTLSERQICSIARSLLRDPRVLILDEATSALDYESCQKLFGVVRNLRDKGVGIILITHRMDEIEAIGDRVTVLRSGVSVGTIEGGWTTAELVRMMTGDDHLVPDAVAEERNVDPDAEVLLSAVGVKLAPGKKAIDFGVRAGELVGLAGLEGNGQEAFLKALAGLVAVEGTVVRRDGDIETVIDRAQTAYSARVVYVPRERRAQALFEWMSIQDNFAVPTIGKDAVAGWLSSGRTANRFSEFVDRLRITLGRPTDAITTLSGGNQQKVVIARWLAAHPRVLLLNDPTRGIDINAKRDLYRLLRELTANGLAVVMLSTEVDEHLELMDRVLVFREDECVRELHRQDLSRAGLVAGFFGKEIA
jgi:ABC-type sugar transport system ATPase subunit